MVTVPAQTVTHEGSAIERYDVPETGGNLEEAAAFVAAHTKGPKKPLRDDYTPGYSFRVHRVLPSSERIPELRVRSGALATNIDSRLDLRSLMSGA